MTGAELKRAREKLDMTQAELAEALGMKTNSIARMEREERPIMRVTELAIKHLLTVESKKPRRGRV